MKKENKIKSWVHDLKDIHRILKLDDYVVVSPIAFPVLSVLEEKKETKATYSM